MDYEGAAFLRNCSMFAKLREGLQRKARKAYFQNVEALQARTPAMVKVLIGGFAAESPAPASLTKALDYRQIKWLRRGHAQIKNRKPLTNGLGCSCTQKNCSRKESSFFDYFKFILFPAAWGSCRHHRRLLLRWPVT